MRVLRQGEMEVKCPKCHCTLAADANDIKFNDSSHGKPYFVLCGSCRGIIYLTGQDIPDWMHREIPGF